MVALLQSIMHIHNFVSDISSLFIKVCEQQFHYLLQWSIGFHQETKTVLGCSTKAAYTNT